MTSLLNRHRWMPHLLLSLCLVSCTAAGASLQGQASVVDGDTLDIHGQRIRLHGVDAPESSQACVDRSGKSWRCGQQAALSLDDLIAGRTVSCQQRDMDRYGRIVAVCEVAGTTVNRWLVRNGWAMAYRQYSTDYVGDERQARSEQLNIWSGEFVPPAQYRRTGGKPVVSAPDPACKLKGNINSKGTRIVHSPGQQHYEHTRIDTSDGERWFCTAEEAEQAGWRPARA